MALYRCALFTQVGPQPGFKTLHAENDAGARHLALELLRNSPELDRIEVWRDADLAFRLSQHQRHLESPPVPDRDGAG